MGCLSIRLWSGCTYSPPRRAHLAHHAAVIENKRLPELVESQVRYLTEPRTWVRLAPSARRTRWSSPPASGAAAAARPLLRRPVSVNCPRHVRRCARGGSRRSPRPVAGGPVPKPVGLPAGTCRCPGEPRPCASARPRAAQQRSRSSGTRSGLGGRGFRSSPARRPTRPRRAGRLYLPAARSVPPLLPSWRLRFVRPA